MTTIRESTGALMRRLSAGTDGQIDGLINRKELKAHAVAALVSGLVGGGIIFLSAMQIALPQYAKDPLLGFALSSLLASWIAHLKGINTGAKLAGIAPGEPAPATGAVAPADAMVPSTGGPPLPYTDVLTGEEWPSYRAYLVGRHDPNRLPPEA